MSFYGSKIIWTFQIILVEYQLFWTGPIHYGQVKIIEISPEKSNLNLTKSIWTVQNNFGPIEGQGIRLCFSCLICGFIFSKLDLELTSCLKSLKNISTFRRFLIFSEYFTLIFCLWSNPNLQSSEKISRDSRENQTLSALWFQVIFCEKKLKPFTNKKNFIALTHLDAEDQVWEGRSVE